MCTVTYDGISTRKNDFNSYVENIMRARWAHLKSPKRVESTQELGQTSRHQPVKSSRKNHPGGALQLRLRQYSERPSGPSITKKIMQLGHSKDNATETCLLALWMQKQVVPDSCEALKKKELRGMLLFKLYPPAQIFPNQAKAGSAITSRRGSRAWFGCRCANGTSTSKGRKHHVGGLLFLRLVPCTLIDDKIIPCCISLLVRYDCPS